jgi:hypothetical protein
VLVAIQLVAAVGALRFAVAARYLHPGAS